MSTLGQKITKARIDRRLKQKDLAAMTGLSQKYVSMVERGHVNPRFDLVVRLAKVLQVSLDSLVPDDDEEATAA